MILYLCTFVPKPTMEHKINLLEHLIQAERILNCRKEMRSIWALFNTDNPIYHESEKINLHNRFSQLQNKWKSLYFTDLCWCILNQSDMLCHQGLENLSIVDLNLSYSPKLTPYRLHNKLQPFCEDTPENHINIYNDKLDAQYDNTLLQHPEIDWEYKEQQSRKNTLKLLKNKECYQNFKMKYYSSTKSCERTTKQLEHTLDYIEHWFKCWLSEPNQVEPLKTFLLRNGCCCTFDIIQRVEQWKTPDHAKFLNMFTAWKRKKLKKRKLLSKTIFTAN